MKKWGDELCSVSPKELTKDKFIAIPDHKDDVQPREDE